MAMTVTATQGGATANGMGLTVLVLTGASPAASQPGGTKTADTSVSPGFDQPVTVAATGSWVLGALSNGFASAVFTADTRTTMLENFSDTVQVCAYGTFKSTVATASTGATTYGATNALNGGTYAAAEILAAGTIAQDASTPSPASSGTNSAIALTSAVFTPAPGSLVAVIAAANALGSGTPTMTITNTGGLTFVQKAFFGPANAAGTSGVWVADVAGGSVAKAQKIRLIRGNPGAIPSQSQTVELIGARYGR